MSSIWGKYFTVDIFGESHGSKIGVVLNGLPSGVQLDLDRIQAFMDRRRAGSEAWTTSRREPDKLNIVSGFFEGRTTGTPLCMMIDNTDTRSADYDTGLNRPGHADYSGSERYGGFNDPRGSGHFSGRLTAPLVFAGAVAAQIVSASGVFAATHIERIADVQDKRFDAVTVDKAVADKLAAMRFPLIDASLQQGMQQRVIDAAETDNSVGGVIECAVVGLPAGLGSPMTQGVESRLTSLLFSIPAIKGVEFGDGFGLTAMTGSEANDEYEKKGSRIVTTTNHNGGILGGITTGMPVVFRAAVKPTSSIALPQKTVNLKTGKAQTLKVQGRHDPCIVPRAVAVVEAAAYISMLDLMLERSANHGI